MTPLLGVAGGYLAGSIPFAVVVSRLMGLPDPRTYGSGNTGATNVLRSGSRSPRSSPSSGDAAKGWAAVLVALALELPVELVALVGFMAFLGHVFPGLAPVQGRQGRGHGRGRADRVRLARGRRGHGRWLAVVVATRYSSLGSIVAALFAPVAAWHILGAGPMLVAVVAMSVGARRAPPPTSSSSGGEESRIGDKKKPEETKEAAT